METTKWVLDPAHSEIAFKVKHLMISTVTGKIGQFSAQVSNSGEDFSNSTIEFEADLSTLDTNNGDRDNHLKSADFFHVEQFPKLKFKSTSVTANSNGNYDIKGELTIKDITKPISFEAEFGGKAQDPWGNAKAGFSIDTKINREDFGLTWNAALETGGVLVGTDVRILAEIQLLAEVSQPA